MVFKKIDANSVARLLLYSIQPPPHLEFFPFFPPLSLPLSLLSGPPSPFSLFYLFGSFIGHLFSFTRARETSRRCLSFRRLLVPDEDPPHHLHTYIGKITCTMLRIYNSKG